MSIDPPSLPDGPPPERPPQPSPAVRVAGIAIISVVLSGAMALFMAAVNVGFGARFLPAALIGWGLGCVVSFPIALLTVPFVVRWQMRQAARAAEIATRRVASSG